MSQDSILMKDSLFRLLDRWRHFPAYRLEPRVDIFFALYLRNIVASFVAEQIHDVLIPEFPLRRGTLWGESIASRNASVKVDYLLTAESRANVYLLELKTDAASRRQEQDEYLVRARQIGFHSLIDGLLTILERTETRYLQKYVHLLRALEELGFVRIPPELFEFAFPVVQRGVTKWLREVENTVPEADPTINILYLQPHPDPEQTVIDFEFCAKLIKQYDDPFSQTFATHLLRWTTEAGSSPPQGMSA